MNDEQMPWYMWLVLAGALGMSAPGEYHLAVVAHWEPAVAWVMPLVVSVYGAVAAYIAKKARKGTPERRSAVAGALAALLLALAFQVTAHLMTAGYVHESAWLVAAVSATPPVVVAHLMHMPHVTAKRASRSATAMLEEAEAVAAVAVSGHPVEMAVQPAVVAEGPAPGTGTEAVAVPPVAATVAASEPVAAPAAAVAAPTATGQVAKEAARPDAVPDVRTEQAATASDDDGGPDMLPGLTLVATGDRPAGAARNGRGPSIPDAATVRAAMAVLTARGVPVTGRTVANHFGVAERTGRRYLKMAA
ncbi:hypothetical protein AB0K71_28430 [Streptomyces syringium]|uniref:hypothetical protein n=1 Tax=Streptomyces syringium TaxID=76729 RepID=UPI0033A64ECF